MKNKRNNVFCKSVEKAKDSKLTSNMNVSTSSLISMSVILFCVSEISINKSRNEIFFFSKKKDKEKKTNWVLKFTTRVTLIL